MRPEIEEYLREQGWVFAGVSQPDHKRQWAQMDGDKVKRVALESELEDLALEIVGSPTEPNDSVAKEMFIKALERAVEQTKKGYELTDCDKHSWWEDFKAYSEIKPAAWSEEYEQRVAELKTLIAQCNGFNKANRQKVFELIDSLRSQLEARKQPGIIEHICLGAGIPAPFMDGNQWCILKGDNIQAGVVGFGDTKEDALIDFIRDIPILREQPKKEITREEMKFQVAVSCIQGILEAKLGIIGEVVPEVAVKESLRIADEFVRQWFGNTVVDKVEEDVKECSEDEKIRKAIEGTIRVYGKTQGEWLCGYDMDTLVVHLREAFGALEKQKEPRDYRKLCEEVVKSNWFKENYVGKSLGEDYQLAEWSEEDDFWFNP